MNRAFVWRNMWKTWRTGTCNRQDTGVMQSAERVESAERMKAAERLKAAERSEAAERLESEKKMETAERMEAMRKRAGKKTVCLLSVIMMMMSLAAGCGGQEEAAGSGGQDGEGAGQQATMGRYVETERNLPDPLEEAGGIYKLPDGQLVLIGRQGELFVSKDNGAVWEQDSRQWLKETATAAGAYIMDVKMDSKGNMGIVYAEDDGAESGETAVKCVLLMADDTVVPIALSGAAAEESIDRFWISGDDRYFVSTTSGNLYEVKEDGSSRLYLTAEGYPQTVCFQGSLMILDGYELKAPLLYDMEKEAYVEDETLAAFVQDNYADRGFNGAGWQNMCLFPGEDDVIYLAGRKGLHRHVIGGAGMEQIIDGRLSRLGNPQYGTRGMVFLESGEFLAASDNGKLIQFTYDPDRVAVPKEKLKVYSLEKNVDLSTAVSFYQIQNPDVFVEYEVGMDEGEAVTREDAVRKLNTKILAGEGPDVLLLDGLPVDSYMEKGMLAELNALVEELGTEVFENLITAFAKEDRIYAVPGQVRLPVVMGRADAVSGITGAADLADRIEEMRRELPHQDLIGHGCEKAILKICAIFSAQDWKDGNGEIDTDAIAGFLTQGKRIYEAQMDGLEEKSVERLQQSIEAHEQYEGEDWMYDLTSYGFYMDYAAGNTAVYAGVSHSPGGYAELASISRADGFEDTVLVPVTREDGSVFLPETVLGINAATQKKEQAEGFIRLFLGKENQRSLSGYAVNRAAFEEAAALQGKEADENGVYGRVGMMYEDGSEFSLELFLPTDAETAAVKEWMETAAIPYIEDRVLEEGIFEEGALFLLGGRGLEETLDAIEKRLAVYIAE